MPKFTQAIELLGFLLIDSLSQANIQLANLECLKEVLETKKDTLIVNVHIPLYPPSS